MTPSWETFDAQIDDLLDGTLEEAAAEAIAQRVAREPAAQQRYLERMAMAAALEDSPTLSMRAAEPVARVKRFPRTWAIAAAWLIGTMLLTMIWMRTDSRAPLTPSDRSPVAVVSGLEGSLRVDTGRMLSVGQALPMAAVQVSGLAEIEFASGAVVVIEGPAAVEVLGENGMQLAGGRLLADVPDRAFGFSVFTSTMRAIDLGTRFGVIDTPEGSDVHVLKGRVEVWPGHQASNKHRLAAGHAIRVAHAGAIDSMAADPSVFVSSQDLSGSAGYRQWLIHNRSLAADPACLYHEDFRFHPPQRRTAMGRWAGKQAAEFHQPGDGIPILLPGRHRQITLSAWVRFDRFDQAFHALLMSDGWDRGDVHWQLHRRDPDDLRLEFSVRHAGPFSHDQSTKTDYFSEDALDDADAQRWMHLAVIYDADAGFVEQFVDGRSIGREVITRPGANLEIGRAQIGNWDRPHERDVRPVRVMIGRMDEISVFSRALTKQNIEQMAAMGRPEEAMK